MPNVRDRNAGFATGQAQVWGFDTRTGIDSKSYGAPGAKIFYVDPNNAQAVDAGNLGEDPTVPLATVAQALTLARGYMGDTIIVGANDDWQHAAGVRNTALQESIVIPSTLGGIRIVGISSSSIGVPWQAATDDGTCITVNATDILIEGFCFWDNAGGDPVGITSVWNGTTSFGDNLTVRNCFFEAGMDYGITLDYCYYCNIHDNYFEGVNTAAIHNLAVEGNPDYSLIHDNNFYNNTVALSLDACVGLIIYDNRIIGAPAGTDNFIALAGGATNLVANNWLGCTVAQYDGTCDGGGAGNAWINNHCIDGDPVAIPLG